MSGGRVLFVGCEPGAPDLLTLDRAWRRNRRARPSAAPCRGTHVTAAPGHGRLRHPQEWGSTLRVRITTVRPIAVRVV